MHVGSDRLDRRLSASRHFPVSWMEVYAPLQRSVQVGMKPSPQSMYIASLYWATMTVTTIGHGDITPTTEMESVMCICGMLLGASAYAYIIGSVCGVIALMDQATSKYNQQMDELNLYMSENRMPAKLRIKLREYFQYCKQLNRQLLSGPPNRDVAYLEG